MLTLMSPRVEQVSKLLSYVLFVIVACGVIALQMLHFAERSNYRDDEIRTVHAGMTMSVPEVVQWMSVDIHPPLWRITATVWVSLFGPTEQTTRFLSVIYTVLALAFLFRLTADLFDRWVGVLAVFILGTHALFYFYTHEFRPYAALTMWTVALHWSLLRYVRRPNFGNAVTFTVFGIAALYTHFFALYVLASQFITLLLVLRLPPSRLLRLTGLYVAIGLAFTGWLPSFLHSFLVFRPGGITYAIEPDLANARLIYTSLQMRPYSLGNLLLPSALLLPVRWLQPSPLETDKLSRLGVAWRKWYFILTAGVMFLAVLVTNPFVGVLTQRNLLITLPTLAVLAALSLRLIPWQMTVLALLLILNPAVRDFINYQSNQPYQEALAFIEPTYDDHDLVIISVDEGTGDYFAFAYYLLDHLPERMTQADMVYLTLGSPRENLPDPMLNPITDDAPANLQHFRQLTDDSPQVWWIASEDGLPPYLESYAQTLAETHEMIRSQRVESPYHRKTYIFHEYRRPGN